jgi:hypothetical protein
MNSAALSRTESRRLVLDLVGLFDAHPDIETLTLVIREERGYMNYLADLKIQMKPGTPRLPEEFRDNLRELAADIVADGAFTPLGEYFLDSHDLSLSRPVAAGHLQTVYDECFGAGTWAKDEAAALVQHLEQTTPDPVPESSTPVPGRL